MVEAERRAAGPDRSGGPTPRTAREVLDRARDFLRGKGVEEARLDAELLVGHALGIDRLGLFLELERPVSEAERDAARELLVRRGKGEPVAYLVGEREFYGRPFRVGPGCLVPRPETELIVDAARGWWRERSGADVATRERQREEARARLEEAAARGEDPESVELPTPGEPAPAFLPRVLDLGTGSGCLAVTLALECTCEKVVAVERSEEALAWARTNAEALEAEVEFRRADALEFLGAVRPASVDLVVSNPPYVDPGDRGELPREVREFEPDEALYAPEGDVDRWARELVRRVPGLLRPGGLLLVELGQGQGPRVLAEARGQEGVEAELMADLAGIERVLAVTRQA